MNDFSATSPEAQIVNFKADFITVLDSGQILVYKFKNIGEPVELTGVFPPSYVVVKTNL